MVACMGTSLEAVRGFFDVDDETGEYDHEDQIQHSYISAQCPGRYAGNGPLHFAAIFGRTEIAEFLLATGVDAHRPNCAIDRAIKLAKVNGHVATAARMQQILQNSSSRRRTREEMDYNNFASGDSINMRKRERF